MDLPFRNRAEAGKILALKLITYGDPQLQILALPRGGVPVAYEIARMLNAPLDIFMVRKLGVPGNKELAMGAIASGGLSVVNQELLNRLQLDEREFYRVAAREQRELERRERLYRGDRPPPQLAGRSLIVVDDGLATGSTMRAAVLALRQQRPARIVVAAPVGSRAACASLRPLADALVCANVPPDFHSVGFWYKDFAQTSDEEVYRLLELSSYSQRQLRERERGG